MPKLTAPGLAALAALAGCTGLFRSDAKPEQTYVLRAPPAKVQAAPAPAGTDGSAAPAAPAAAPLAVLQVAHPLSAPGLEGPHIMLVQADHRMNFYLGSRWPAPLPDLVEALATDTLRGTGDWQSIEDSGSPFPAQYLLQISVRRFDADYTRGGGTPTVEVVLDCTLGARTGRELVASFVAEGSASARGDRMSEVVDAFARASDAAFASLAQQAGASARAFAAGAGKR
ncbi:MAG TPA: ABC-type transport auxiliary lipoprotein family protein [Steroidobacteraceae bacterium]|nr:ABC-type transport auxiliary lipoprotein family protein [Steroidobacteraceae bacterium]